MSPASPRGRQAATPRCAACQWLSCAYVQLGSLVSTQIFAQFLTYLELFSTSHLYLVAGMYEVTHRMSLHFTARVSSSHVFQRLVHVLLFDMLKITELLLGNLMCIVAFRLH